MSHSHKILILIQKWAKWMVDNKFGSNYVKNVWIFGETCFFLLYSREIRICGNCFWTFWSKKLFTDTCWINTGDVQPWPRKNAFLARILQDPCKNAITCKILQGNLFLARSCKEMFSLKDLARKCFPWKILQGNFFLERSCKEMLSLQDSWVQCTSYWEIMLT